MNTSQAVAHFGGVKKLADALGIGRAAVYQWGDEPPIDRQCQIEVMTSGALKADRQKVRVQGGRGRAA